MSALSGAGRFYFEWGCFLFGIVVSFIALFGLFRTYEKVKLVESLNDDERARLGQSATALSAPKSGSTVLCAGGAVQCVQCVTRASALRATRRCAAVMLPQALAEETRAGLWPSTAARSVRRLSRLMHPTPCTAMQLPPRSMRQSTYARQPATASKPTTMPAVEHHAHIACTRTHCDVMCATA
jgi:hypothetical protein